MKLILECILKIKSKMSLVDIIALISYFLVKHKGIILTKIKMKMLII